MIVDRPLMTVTPTVDGDVLTVLARADGAFTAPDVERVLERHSVAGIRKVLNRLVDQGIVLADRAGRTFTYRLNRDHLAAPSVIELARLGDVLIERIRGATATWERPAALVMLFGSASSGAMRTDSDIDVFVVRGADIDDEPGWNDQIAGLERNITAWTGNDARVLEYSLDDLGHQNDTVIGEIAEHGTLIVGDRALLQR